MLKDGSENSPRLAIENEGLEKSPLFADIENEGLENSPLLDAVGSKGLGKLLLFLSGAIVKEFLLKFADGLLKSAEVLENSPVF